MSERKILVVFGATGNQGGSVISTFLSDPLLVQQFQLRGITRDPSKAASSTLAKQGVSMIKADTEDKDSLRAALKDAYAVFAVTNWAETWSPAREEQQGKNIADISKELGIKYLIWSSQPYVSKLSNGAFTGVQHFDSKGRVEEYISSLNIPATYLYVGGFFSYPLMHLSPSPTSTPEKKSYVFQSVLPATTRLPLISANVDIGKFVRMILLNPSETTGKQVQAAEGWYTMLEIVATMKAGGLDLEFEEVSAAQYREGVSKMGAPEWFVEDMSQLMHFIQEYGLFGGKEKEKGVDKWKALVGERLETFKEWVERSSEFAALK